MDDTLLIIPSLPWARNLSKTIDWVLSVLVSAVFAVADMSNTRSALVTIMKESLPGGEGKEENSWRSDTSQSVWKRNKTYSSREKEG